MLNSEFVFHIGCVIDYSDTKLNCVILKIVRT